MTASRCRIVVLGGYGHFGTHVCRALAAQPDLEIVVSGRSLQRAAALIAQLQTAPGTTLTPTRLDHQRNRFAPDLAALKPAILIHAAGPFQHQSYRVAAVCIDLGIHYVDLADGREFVTGIGTLHARAAARGVLIVSGASTLPALSDAVLQELTSDLADCERIEISIAPGQHTPRGLATVEGVLTYCGRPFLSLRDGRAATVYGWQDLHVRRYPELGRRWLANCDVPDLELLPQRFDGLRTVECYAALELAPLALSMWLLSWLSRWRWVDNWAPYASLLSRVADLLDRFGSDVGGMHVGVTGRDRNGQELRKDWYLVARQGHGPRIPATPAVIVATKLARGEINDRGALPCTGVFSLSDFARAVSHLDIAWETVTASTATADAEDRGRQGQLSGKAISS